MLAAKAALAIRYDALAEGDAEGSVEFAIEARTQLEKRARELELRKAKIGGGGFKWVFKIIFDIYLKYCQKYNSVTYPIFQFFWQNLTEFLNVTQISIDKSRFFFINCEIILILKRRIQLFLLLN